jgi:pimeloyl-ACP methyl ester carboxylesterase
MIEEKIIVGEGTPYPLNGCLTLPENTENPVPAVVFVHGSGSSNMDEKVGKLTPFRDLAYGLAAHGIASVRYDKRTFAHAFKLLRDKSLTVTVKEETIEDAILAAELLRKDPRIDPHKVFLIGHSMGGMLAPRIDAEGGNFRGLILLAGTPRRLEEVLVEQNNEALAGMKGLLRRLVEKQIGKLNHSFDGLYEMSDEEAKAKKMGGGVTLYYFKEMGEPTVESYLKSTEKPILVMQGERDFQVKADTDFRMYKEILADHPDSTFILYENLNHAFVPSVYGSLLKAKQEYAKEQHIGENVISDIARWIWRVSEA